MLVKLIEIYNKRTFAANVDEKVEEFSLREVLVNPEHVVCVRENDSLKNRLSETNLDKRFILPRDSQKYILTEVNPA